MTPFGLAGYERLIAALAAGPRPLARFESEPESGLLLRLDVDYDLGWAVRTARINAAHGVAATYFVMVGGELYNPAGSARADLAELVRLGQSVGLHHYCPAGAAPSPDDLKAAFAWLTHLAGGATVPVVSWHNPEGPLEAANAAAAAAGLVSAYDPRWFGPERYRSDSNMRNDSDGLAKFAASATAPVIQVLLHPITWAMDSEDMDRALRSAFAEKMRMLSEGFASNRVWSAQTGPALAPDLDEFRRKVAPP